MLYSITLANLICRAVMLLYLYISNLLYIPCWSLLLQGERHQRVLTHRAHSIPHTGYRHVQHEADRQEHALGRQDTRGIRSCDHHIGDTHTHTHHYLLPDTSQHLMDQSDFLVAGVLGKQGAGKSTVMSLLAGTRTGSAR